MHVCELAALAYALPCYLRTNTTDKKPSLKTTGAIYTLCLTGKSINKIAGLGECSNLTDLNLSNNSITR